MVGLISGKPAAPLLRPFMPPTWLPWGRRGSQGLGKGVAWEQQQEAHREAQRGGLSVGREERRWHPREGERSAPGHVSARAGCVASSGHLGFILLLMRDT